MGDLMKKFNEDKDYLKIVNDILNNNEFKKLKEYKHHGDNRMDHCIRVSYGSYLFSKKLRLKTKEITRGALLHDFFLINNQEISLAKRIKVLIIHPKISLYNSKKYFKISSLEENIILSHMFPLYLILPKHRESWIVNTVDKFVSIYERYFTIKNSIINKFRK